MVHQGAIGRRNGALEPAARHTPWVDRPGVEDLRALHRRDEELAAASRKIAEAAESTASIRIRAEAIAAFSASFADEEARLRAGVDDAGRELARRREELVAAERAVADAAADEQERERLERSLARGRDHVRLAESRLERARAASERLEGDAAELPAELARLEQEAAALAEQTGLLPAPGAVPGGMVDWASQARAELFVALGQIDRQREQVIRESNELATMLLGEPTFGSTPAQALARVERGR